MFCLIFHSLNLAFSFITGSTDSSTASLRGSLPLLYLVECQVLTVWPSQLHNIWATEWSGGRGSSWSLLSSDRADSPLQHSRGCDAGFYSTSSLPQVSQSHFPLWLL